MIRLTDDDGNAREEYPCGCIVYVMRGERDTLFTTGCTDFSHRRVGASRRPGSPGEARDEEWHIRRLREQENRSDAR